MLQLSAWGTDNLTNFTLRDHPFKTSAFFRGGGVKNWPNLQMDSSKKNCRREGVGVKNCENLPTSLMDGPIHVT